MSADPYEITIRVDRPYPDDLDQEHAEVGISAPDYTEEKYADLDTATINRAANYLAGVIARVGITLTDEVLADAVQHGCTRRWRVTNGLLDYLYRGVCAVEGYELAGWDFDTDRESSPSLFLHIPLERAGYYADKAARLLTEIRGSRT